MFDPSSTSEYRIERSTGDGRDWDGYVSAHPSATNYHLFGWRAVIAESFHHPTYYLTARDGAGKIVGVLPLVHMRSALFGSFLISVPFVNYGGLLVSNPAAIPALLAEAELILGETGASHLELRHLDWQHPGLTTKSHKVTMLLPLAESVADQWKLFNPKLRNQIRKAEKSGLAVVEGGIELLDGFYEVFCRNMRDLGTPVYGRNFFAHVLTEFPTTTRIFTVMLDRQVVAAGLASWSKGVFEIPWASSNRDYKALCPNNILYWRAISAAIEQGFTTFDFGRSTPNEGTYNFKKQWGAQAVPLFWQYLLPAGRELPELNPKNPKFALFIKIWQRLPLWLTNTLGPKIVRSIP